MTIKKHHIEFGGYQGDVVLIRVDPSSLPPSEKLEEIHPVVDIYGKYRHVITHSETGHHHVIDVARPDIARYFVDTSDPEPIVDLKQHFLLTTEPVELEHLRSHHTHETHVYEPGLYKVLRQRAFTTKGSYAVATD